MGIWTTTSSLYFLTKHHQHLLSAQSNLQSTLRELYHHEELLQSCPPELLEFLSTYVPTSPRKFWQFFDPANDGFRVMAADTLHIAQDLVHRDYSILEQPLKAEYKLLKRTVEKWLQPAGLQPVIGRYILPSYTCLDHVCEKGELRGTWIDNREFAEMVALAWDKAVERQVGQLGFGVNNDVVGEWSEELRSVWGARNRRLDDWMVREVDEETEEGTEGRSSEEEVLKL
ncbi:hypothetical protein TWF102_005685 [Orbilia oligospora]|uniref:Uncharacterized protein n=1 Tax=Orbilia oligospora TaxID=2813651 RepID=A0A6G1MCH5_ORBOL|nr:hypothetical protein TWF706_011816 [Orbilia oligospora]KAF3111924.1 hypothetical protein TWF102_005685 [Orbilia oligospora]KAF3114609.1 hypothetical protein TWF103_001069 [Orbilia oligospora]KAF3142019.1 hypothetical protein TWF703_001242 [Orbilia oligospora]KAF3146468.1 hypothetical protein TWF594_003261 [Orbilia oligospora]